MRVVIAGGGTGGHLFPGIALAEELTLRGGHEVLFVGTAKGIEARAVPKEGYALALIDVGGLKGRGPLGLLRGLLRVPRALVQSLAILRRFSPDLVVGVGGYASGPMVLAAALTLRPTAILEQNSVPGVTNRMLGQVVRAVFAAFPDSRAYFPKKKVRLLGNPIRARLRAALTDGASPVSPATQQKNTAPQHDAVAAEKPDAATQHDAAASSRTTLLVCGGSQGAHPVNEAVMEAVALLFSGSEKPNLRVIHQTGRDDRATVEARYRALGVDAAVHEFIDDMAAAYRAADLVVARAGATTLAEITALGRASILIPFPQAADDHQTKNARSLEAAGAALLLPQKTLTPRALADAVAALAADDLRRARMAAAARALGRPAAASEIVDALLALGRK